MNEQWIFNVTDKDGNLLASIDVFGEVIYHESVFVYENGVRLGNSEVSSNE